MKRNYFKVFHMIFVEKVKIDLHNEGLRIDWKY